MTSKPFLLRFLADRYGNAISAAALGLRQRCQICYDKRKGGGPMALYFDGETYYIDGLAAITSVRNVKK